MNEDGYYICPMDFTFLGHSGYKNELIGSLNIGESKDAPYKVTYDKKLKNGYNYYKEELANYKTLPWIEAFAPIEAVRAVMNLSALYNKPIIIGDIKVLCKEIKKTFVYDLEQKQKRLSKETLWYTFRVVCEMPYIIKEEDY